VSTGATLRFIGVNPVLLRVTGTAQISGTIDVAGKDGQNGGGAVAAAGAAGPAGGPGGRSINGPSGCNVLYGTVQNCSASPFTYILSSCGTGWPWSRNGEGPGRGHAGGSSGGYYYYSAPSYIPQSGTGGGGGSRAATGTRGEDRTSASAPSGSGGNCSGAVYTLQNSSVVGVRGMPGTVHGDPELFDVTWGGSGGGAGGATAGYSTTNVNQAGGAGGGGGGMFTLACAGTIHAAGGRIDASGGDGGAGGYKQYLTYNYYFMLSGGGGGGSGGGICLISGDNILANNAVFDASGGSGGAAPTITAGTCTNCNRGGNGGKGFIYLMDADGTIPGLLPGTPGTYPSYATGYLTIAPLAAGATRFGEIRAVTELFNVLAANPAFAQIDEDSDILANVSQGQQIFVYMSSAKADLLDPLVPDVASEIPPVLVARVHYALGATQVDADSYMAMDQLNPTGPNRDAYVRIDAFFDYGAQIVQAALGPFMSMDRMDIRYLFNG
jgi:hypothetical protein